MTSPLSASSVLSWFATVAPREFLDKLMKQHAPHARQRMYTATVVLGLMIHQRLDHDASLQAAVLAHIARRKGRAPRVSTASGAYCQARQRLPTLVAEQVSDHVFETLRARTPGPRERPVYLVDGTTVRLAHAPELVRAFPPGRNVRGENHWPLLRLVAFHDAHTGLAMRPSWGPANGEEAVSEQHLAAQSLDRLPPDALVLGDANFGIFAFAHAVAKSQRPLLLRLTVSRATKILGRAPNKPGRYKVTWTPSAWERSRHPELPPEAQVVGYLVVCRHPQKRGEKLYLFTTLDLKTKEVLALYKLRWNVETDLRDLKCTVHLEELRGRSVEVVEKELLLAVTAYNLVRTVMHQAAQVADCTPRQMSFAGVQAAVLAALPALEQAGSPQHRQRLLRELIELASHLRLPRRKRKRRSYPRQVWSHGAKYPNHARSPERSR